VVFDGHGVPQNSCGGIIGAAFGSVKAASHADVSGQAIVRRPADGYRSGEIEQGSDDMFRYLKAVLACSAIFGALVAPAGAQEIAKVSDAGIHVIHGKGGNIGV
jgi:hypothetical protein